MLGSEIVHNLYGPSNFEISIYPLHHPSRCQIISGENKPIDNDGTSLLTHVHTCKMDIRYKMDQKGEQSFMTAGRK